MKDKKNLKMIIMGVMILGIVACIYLFLNPLYLKSDHVTLDVNQKYDYHENIKFLFFGDKEDVKISKKIDTSKIDEYTIQYKYKDKKLPCTITVTDLSAPVLKVKDYKTDTIEEVKAESFVESCEDFSEYTLDFSLEESEEEKGVYTVTVKAKDSFNNESSETCTLTRVEDKTAPTLENFEESISVMQGDYFDYEKVETKDDFDPKPEVTIDGYVDFGYPGTYTLSYTVIDRSQNIGVYNRSIVVNPNKEDNMKVVYLTFDDGPSYNTSKVLDILDKYHVKATFFVTGNGQQYNDCILRAYNAGHAIGLHTYCHDYATVYSSEDAYFNDLASIGSMVKNIIGFTPSIIRFPGGSSNTVSANYEEGIMSELVKKVQQKGYQYYDWNVSSEDASGINVDTDRIIEAATSGSGNKIMILFHDAYGKDTTVEALPEVIKYYKDKGYVFMPITKGESYACHHGVNN